jgi:hypothetical protein
VGGRQFRETGNSLLLFNLIESKAQLSVLAEAPANKRISSCNRSLATVLYLQPFSSSATVLLQLASSSATVLFVA